MISENTRDGVAAAETSGKTLGRPAALNPDQVVKVVEVFGKGSAVKALARQYQVDPKTIRRVLDDAGARELPQQLDPQAPGEQQPAPAPNPEVVLDLPGLLADHLASVGDETIRAALSSGRTIRHGQGHSLRIIAPLELHRTALQQAAALAAEAASPAERKAHRVYATRITAAATAPDQQGLTANHVLIDPSAANCI